MLSKITNKQYLAINLLEAPLLGFILSYFLRYIMIGEQDSGEYVFYENDNLIVYMFMAIIVALFLGLTVSAEEIFKDQKIRKRESFLSLSKGSYLISKIVIMFLLSGIQMFMFILLGNLILGIDGVLWDYWLILFSTACFANMLGLNISASFNSAAVTIYIIIPFLIIPQILFSGVLVKFEKLNPVITSQSIVPLIGEVMASRWAFEALAVNQFVENDYEKLFYDYDQQMSDANFKKNFWIPEMKAKVGKFKEYLRNKESADIQDLTSDFKTVRGEVSKENKFNDAITFDELDQFTLGGINQELLEDFSTYLTTLNKLYVRQWNNNSDEKDRVIREHQKTDEEKTAFNNLRNNFENESLSDLVTNKNEFNQITEYDGELIQRADPVFNIPDGFRSHFYAPKKLVFGKYYSTKQVNVLVLWLMSIALAISLYFDGLKRLLNVFSEVKIFNKKK